jgi:hypothetical protein
MVVFVCSFVSMVVAQDKLVIAMVPKALDNPVFTTTREAAKEAAAELGVELIWTASQRADAAEQVAVIESLIQKKVDAIGISVNDPTALKDVIDKAVEAGIVISTWDSDSSDSKRLFYLGTDNYAGGVQCGELMKGLLPDGGKVTILTGVIGIRIKLSALADLTPLCPLTLTLSPGGERGFCSLALEGEGWGEGENACQPVDPLSLMRMGSLGPSTWKNGSEALKMRPKTPKSKWSIFWPGRMILVDQWKW